MRWIAATLVGLLALSYALIALSTPGTEVHPAPTDRGFGGLSILSDALRQSGYRVGFDPSTRPHLAPADVLIIPVLEDNVTPSVALRHVENGGRAFVIGVPRELQAVSGSEVAIDTGGRKVTIDQTRTASALPATPDGEIAAATDWSSGDDSITFLSRVGKGKIARLENGALATNRFLGRRENAQIVLGALATVAKPGDHLVFLAGGYGEAESPGSLETIGPWAVGALWQALGVFAAFGIARGIRFGLPAGEVVERRGARELLDAVAAFYRRGRRTEAPLAAAARQNPGDVEAQAYGRRAKVSEAEARQVLAALEVRGKRRP